MKDLGDSRVITQAVCFPLSLREQVAAEARKRGLSFSELIRIAIIKEIQVKQAGAGENAGR